MESGLLTAVLAQTAFSGTNCTDTLEALALCSPGGAIPPKFCIAIHLSHSNSDRAFWVHPLFKRKVSILLQEMPGGPAPCSASIFPAICCSVTVIRNKKVSAGLCCWSTMIMCGETWHQSIPSLSSNYYYYYFPYLHNIRRKKLHWLIAYYIQIISKKKKKRSEEWPLLKRWVQTGVANCLFWWDFFFLGR